MEIKKLTGDLRDLEIDFFVKSVLCYESDLIADIEKAMNIGMSLLRKAFEGNVPISEDFITEFEADIQVLMEEKFCINNEVKDIFCGFQYAIDEVNDQIYFHSQCMLEIFSKYLFRVTVLEFGNEPIFDFLYYFYYCEDENEIQEAKNILSDFIINLYLYIICRDFVSLAKIFNRDFLVSPNDNHIPIRIALLNSLNLISELNNSVPNKENIYRIVHAIVGGNEDNVKKYCLSLIGQNSTSQKQITRKHKDFAQRFLNEKKL